MPAMAVIRAPDASLEEALRRPARAFETGVPAFVGLLSAEGAAAKPFAGANSDVVALDVAMWSALEASLGATWGERYLGIAIRGFFENGGRRCYVVGQPAGRASVEQALSALDPIDDFDLLCLPDVAPTQPALPDSVVDWSRILSFCARRTGCFAILDAALDAASALDPKAGSSIAAGIDGARRANAAIYAPWIKVRAGCLGCKGKGAVGGAPCVACLGTGQGFVPPGGHVAGVYCRTDWTKGVHKAPANEEIVGALDLESYFGDAAVSELSAIGVNCIRALPNRGIRVWGARTLAPATEEAGLSFVSARRVLLTVARWLEQTMDAVVFEPNDIRLWARIGRDVSTYLSDLYQRGALVGESASEAFFVKCDSETNPPGVREAGQVIAEIGLALSRPCQFFVVRLVSSASGAELSGALTGI